MPGRQAKTISAATLRRMLIYARRTALPVRNRTTILLSVKAGLRAAEIAKLTWPMVLDAKGAGRRHVVYRGCDRQASVRPARAAAP